jgi:hypothetical protein
VSQRFEIHELTAQDQAGVTYRAVDTETKNQVSIRRFFPFGIGGRGLSDSERTSYQKAVAQLVQLTHQSLQKIVHGGCDPIDGLPFLAAEWRDGQTLADWIGRYPLSPTDAMNVILPALRVCAVLSKTMGHEAIWIETKLQAIVVGERGVLFWPSLGKGIAQPSEPCDFNPMVVFTQRLMGWHGPTIPEQAGEGLGSWLAWLRDAKPAPHFDEVVAKLTAAVGTQQLQKLSSPAPPRATARVLHPARKKRSINGMVVSILLLVMIAAGLCSWAIHQQNQRDAEVQAAVPRPPKIAQPEVPKPLIPEIVAPLQVVIASAPAIVKLPETIAPVPIPIIPSPPLGMPFLSPEISEEVAATTVFSASDPALLYLDKKAVTLEGVLMKLDVSGSGKTIYLLFSEKPKASDGRGTISVKKAIAGLSIAELTPLIGRKIQLSGKLVVKRIFGTFRPEIVIENRAEIVPQ